MSDVRPPMPVAIDGAEALGVDLGRAGVRPGLARGDERGLLRAVEPARLDPVEDLGGVDGHQAGDLARLVGRPSPRA